MTSPRPRPPRGRGDGVAPPHLTVVGRGKVGRALARLARAAGWRVQVLGGRDTPRQAVTRGLVLFAVRDAALAETAARLAPWIRARSAAVHVSGALGPEALGALTVPVGQLHPLLSFSDPRHPPTLVGATALVAGAAPAVRRARSLCRALGLRAVEGRGVDRARYHAAAALVANGASTLLVHGELLLRAAAFPPRDAARALAALLVSVATNTARGGALAALTGPVRRGDVGTVARHLAALEDARQRRSGRGQGVLPPGALAATGELYRALARAQLPLARALGEASADDLDALATRLAAGGTPPAAAAAAPSAAARGRRGPSAAGARLRPAAPRRASKTRPA